MPERPPVFIPHTMRREPLKPKPQKRMYNTKRWRSLRKAQLSAEPCCKFCTDEGTTTPATIVDHVRPHRGNNDLFFDPNNLQSLCAFHHNSTKQSIEKGGDGNTGQRRPKRWGEDGLPIY